MELFNSKGQILRPRSQISNHDLPTRYSVLFLRTKKGLIILSSVPFLDVAKSVGLNSCIRIPFWSRFCLVLFLLIRAFQLIAFWYYVHITPPSTCWTPSGCSSVSLPTMPSWPLVDSLVIAAVVILLIVSSGKGRRYWSSRYQLPPGPLGIPIFGNILQVSALRPYPQVCCLCQYCISTTLIVTIPTDSSWNGLANMERYFTFV